MGGERRWELGERRPGLGGWFDVGWAPLPAGPAGCPHTSAARGASAGGWVFPWKPPHPICGLRQPALRLWVPDTPAEVPGQDGRVCALAWRGVWMTYRLGAHGEVRCYGNPAFSPKPLALLDSSCYPLLLPGWVYFSLSELQYPFNHVLPCKPEVGAERGVPATTQSTCAGQTPAMWPVPRSAGKEDSRVW